MTDQVTLRQLKLYYLILEETPCLCSLFDSYVARGLTRTAFYLLSMLVLGYSHITLPMILLSHHIHLAQPMYSEILT